MLLLEMGDRLYYPSAIDWMWDYCIYLGPYTDSDGNKYDLGVYVRKGYSNFPDHSVSLAAVYGNESGQYLSGPLIKFIDDELYQEAAIRAAKHGLLPSELIETLMIMGIL